MGFGFLRGLGSKIGGFLSKIPSLIGRGVATAGKVAGGVRKVGEVAEAVSRGIGDVAPDSPLRKLGAVASQVAGTAGRVASGIEKGRDIASAVHQVLDPSAGQSGSEEPETEASAQQAEVAGGARKGYNNHFSKKKGAMMGYNSMRPSMYR